MTGAAVNVTTRRSSKGLRSLTSDITIPDAIRLNRCTDIISHMYVLVVLPHPSSPIYSLPAPVEVPLFSHFPPSAFPRREQWPIAGSR